jgi:hypothetical protein
VFYTKYHSNKINWLIINYKYLITRNLTVQSDFCLHVLFRKPCFFQLQNFARHIFFSFLLQSTCFIYYINIVGSTRPKTTSNISCIGSTIYWCRTHSHIFGKKTLTHFFCRLTYYPTRLGLCVGAWLRTLGRDST